MRPTGYFTDPFTDLLFNALLGFTFLFCLAVMFMNPISKLGDANLKAEFIITVAWPDSVPDDVDVWVQDPKGGILSYLDKEVGWMQLDRDDQGNVTDTVTINGEQVVYPVNQEVVTLRGIIGGEYVVNVYFYENRSARPVDVSVKLEKVNPALQVVLIDQLVLERRDEEKTALRFTLTGDGQVESINRNPKRLSPYALAEPKPR